MNSIVLTVIKYNGFQWPAGIIRYLPAGYRHVQCLQGCQEYMQYAIFPIFHLKPVIIWLTQMEARIYYF